MEIEITINYDKIQARTIAVYLIREQKMVLYVSNFWEICEFWDAESVAKAIANTFLVEFCCYTWIEETDQLGNWMLGILKMPCFKTKGLLCPINKLFNKVNEGIPNVEELKEEEWEEKIKNKRY